MGLIDDFLLRYRREYDFYDQAARLAAQMIEGRLQAAGIRSIVTSRAKSVTRLAPKVAARAVRKNYSTISDIYDDIVDLAGVRVALYFPGQRGQVDAILRELFALNELSKEFPGNSSPKYEKRFSGYWATHYRVYLRDALLSEAQKRYSEARIEVQVASVLMHAWSEVEHDLVYKPMQGTLSPEEYAILDELNGLVIAGEIALERLQRAGEQRVAVGSRPFGNHYELAAHLLSTVGGIVGGPISDVGMGRIDLLFELLGRLGLRTPDQLARYISVLHSDTEKRPIAEQIVDQLLAEDAARYAVYEELRSRSPEAGAGSRDAGKDDGPSDLHKAVGALVSAWGEFEHAVLSKLPREALRHGPLIPIPQVLANMGLIDSDTKTRLEPIRRLRNMVVHGKAPESLAELREAHQALRQITAQILEKRSQDIPPGGGQDGGSGGAE